MATRVLVVTSRTAFAEPLSVALRAADLEYTGARGADEVAAAFADDGDTPRGVVLDVISLGDAAATLCDVVRGFARGGDIPVLFVGDGKRGVASTTDALIAGGDGYFPVPVEAQRVIAKIATYIGVALPPLPATLVLDDRGDDDGDAAGAGAVDAGRDDRPTYPELPLPFGGDPDLNAVDDAFERNGRGSLDNDVDATGEGDSADRALDTPPSAPPAVGFGDDEATGVLDPTLPPAHDPWADRAGGMTESDEALARLGSMEAASFEDATPAYGVSSLAGSSEARDDFEDPGAGDSFGEKTIHAPRHVSLATLSNPALGAVVNSVPDAQAVDDEYARDSWSGTAERLAAEVSESQALRALAEEVMSSEGMPVVDPPAPAPVAPHTADHARVLEDLAAQEAVERLRLTELARRRADEEARLHRDTEDMLRREAAERARLEALERRRREEEDRLQREAEDSARREAEERARLEELKRRRQREEERLTREAEEIALRAAAERQKLEALERRRAEEEARLAEEARVVAELEAEERARLEELGRRRRLEEERLQRDEAELLRLTQEEKGKLEELGRRRRAEEERLQRESEEIARKETEERARLEELGRRRRDEEARLAREIAELSAREASERERIEELIRRRRHEEERLEREEGEQKEREAVERGRVDELVRRRRLEEERLQEVAEEIAKKEAQEKVRIVELAHKRQEEEQRLEAERAALLELEASERARLEELSKRRRLEEDRLRREGELLRARELDEKQRLEELGRRRQAEEERVQQELQVLRAREAEERDRVDAIEEQRRQAEADLTRATADKARRIAEEEARIGELAQARREAEEAARAALDERRRLEEQSEARLHEVMQRRHEAEEETRRELARLTALRQEEELARRQLEEKRARVRLGFSAGRLDGLTPGTTPIGLDVGADGRPAVDLEGVPVGDRAIEIAPPVAEPPPPPPFVVLEPAEGRLADGELPLLLLSAHHLGVTGAIDLHNDDGRVRTLFLEQGEPVLVDGDDAALRAEDALLRSGLITVPVFNELRAGPRRSARRTAAVLVEQGALKAEEIFSAVRGALTEQVLSLFEWGAGRFTYREAYAPAADRARLEHDLAALTAEGVRRKYDERRLWLILGGPSTLLGVDDRGRGIPPLSPEERLVLGRLDGSRALEDVVLETGIAPQVVLRTALIGIAAGAVRVLARGVPARPEDAVAAREKAATIDRARVLDKLHVARHGDYFTFLGLPADATLFEVQRAADRIRQRFDPQRYSDPVFADLRQALIEICEVSVDAEGVLGDDALREGYRRNLTAAKPTGASSRRRAGPA